MTDNAAISSQLSALNSTLSSVGTRVTDLCERVKALELTSPKDSSENEEQDNNNQGNEAEEPRDLSEAQIRPVTGHAGPTEGNVNPSGAVGGYIVPEDDIQQEYAVIRDSVSRVKLPSSYKLTDTRRGIRRNDLAAYNVVSRSGRYVETTLKLSGTLTPDAVSQDDLNDLMTVQLAHLRYLEDEYATLVVRGTHSPQTVQIFRTLQSNTSGLAPRHVETLRTASQLSATATDTSQQRGGFRSAPRGDQGYGRRNWGDRRSNFQQFSNRRVPPLASGSNDNPGDEAGH